MTDIYQSAFLIALGWTIAASIWQTALLWMIYQVICNTHRKISPSHKHLIAAILLPGSFGWLSVTLANKYSEAIKLNEYLSGLAANTNAATTHSSNILFSPNSLTDFANQYLPYISAAYLIVLLLLSVKLINAYLYSKQLKTKGLLPIDNHWINLVNKYARKIGIVKKVQIHLSQYISVPATLNFFKPVILLPLAAFNHLTPQQVESIILHELAHIKRNDYLINIIASVIETILFFNPFVHLLGKSLKREREHCCDDYVLQHRFDPHSYASALLSLEQLRVGIQLLAIAATGKNSHQLLGRIKRIMNVTTTNFNYGQKLLALVLMAFIMISVAWLSPSSENNGFSFTEVIYNDDTSPADQLIASAPVIAENKATRTRTLPAKDINIPGASHAKTKQVSNANAPALLSGISHPISPTKPHEVWQIPHPPAAPPAPQSIFNENNDASRAPDPFTVPVSPADIFGNYNFSFNPHNDLLNTGGEHNAMGWENTGEDILKEQAHNMISIDNLIKLMEDAKIKNALINSPLLNGEQLRILINNELYKEHLQLGNIIKNREQELTENLTDLKKMLNEERATPDSIRKASVEAAQKQKEIWLRDMNERKKTIENEKTVVYEFIVHIDDNTPLRPAMAKSLQQNVSVNLYSKSTERERRMNIIMPNNNVSAFTLTPSENNKIKSSGSGYRTLNTERRQRMVISL